MHEQSAQEFNVHQTTPASSDTRLLSGEYASFAPFIGFGVGGLSFGFSNACVGISSGAVVGALLQQAFCVLVACVVYGLRKRLRVLGFEVICASLVVAALALLPFLFIDGTEGQLVFIGCHAVQFIALAVFFIAAFCRESSPLSGCRVAVAIAWSFTGVGIGELFSTTILYSAGLSSVLLHVATCVVITALIAYALASAFAATRITRCAHAEAITENEQLANKGTPDTLGMAAGSAGQACLQLTQQANLSRREEQVLVLLSQGKKAVDIATELVVSGNTVKTHVRNVYRKLGIHSREDLDCLLATCNENEQ